MFVHLLMFVTLFWYILEHFRKKDLLLLAKNVPVTKYKAFPLVGHGYLFIGNDESKMQVFQAMGKEAIDNGGKIMWWFGRKLKMMISDPEIAELVLKTCLQKGEIVQSLRDVTGNASIFADVHIWRPRRKLITPGFTSKSLKQFTVVFSKQSEVMVQQMEKEIRMGDFSIWKYLVAYAMDSVSETSLGIETKALTSPERHEFIECFDKGAKIITQRFVRPWLKIEFIYQLSSYSKNLTTYKNTMYEFIDKIIKNKHQELKCPEKNDPSNTTNGRPKHFKTFVEMMIENSEGPQGCTDLEIREETLLIAMAGTDSSAVGSCFTLLMLAKYPDVQEKVHKEICDVFGGSDRRLTHEDLVQLNYLDAVIKETLRLYPPVPILFREIDRKITLSTGENILPGVEAVINIPAIQRNPKYWGEDAAIFRPERFIDTKLTQPAAFLPFSYGPRNCIGFQYAMMSMKTAVASIMRRFRILRSTKLSDPGTPTNPLINHQTPEYERVKFDVMIKHVNNFMVRLENRVNIQ